MVARLAAAADALAPRAAASRSAVLGAFAAATSNTQHQGAPGRALPGAGAVPGIRRGGRRPALILVLAGLFVLASEGTVAAAAPGGPLYAARIAVEGVFLPSDPASRATAQLGRMAARVAEAEQAARRGDEAGTAAALLEYARIATETAAGTAADPMTDGQLAVRVRAQLASIAGIDAGDPALVSARTEVRLAAGLLLVALNQPADGAEPSAGPQLSGPSDAAAGSPTPAGTSPNGTPATALPVPSAPVAPSSSGGTGHPGGSSDSGGAPPAGGSAGPAGSARPAPTAGSTTQTADSPTPTAVSPTPPPTPRATQNGPAGSGGGSGSPSPHVDTGGR